MVERLIDTSILVTHLRKPNVFEEALSLIERPWTCPIISGELYAGVRSNEKERSDLRAVDNLLDHMNWMSMDRLISKLFGNISLHLRLAGTPIPVNDIWIAACAVRHRLTLVTSDRHFERVPDLSVEYWTS